MWHLGFGQMMTPDFGDNGILIVHFSVLILEYVQRI